MKEVLRFRGRSSSTSWNYDLRPLPAMEKKKGMKEVRGKCNAISNAPGGNVHLRLQIGIMNSSGPIAMFCFNQTIGFEIGLQLICRIGMCITWWVPPHHMFNLLRPIHQTVPLAAVSLDSKIKRRITAALQVGYCPVEKTGQVGQRKKNYYCHNSLEFHRSII